MRLHLKLIGALVMAMLMLAGCSNKHPNVVEMGKVKHIEVIEAQKSRQNGFLVIKVAVENTSRYNQNINYRFQWLDDQGYPVGNEETWKSKLIYGKQSTYINSIAPVMQAVDFRIELQEP
ncbi:YcfL family protein [Entomomonas asaccharolytica]|uniref:YcfL family protein n=1 Tax=Entomomonas asaccharolytica TaxID=2785331 RepID=A0A974NDX7_9GAMM|nr:YcfL family protein [Entomomonas asaccharolytica]QQP84898.1 YcfL family protein [Entomomonas asaccharolytica]